MACGSSQSCGLARGLPLQVTVQRYGKFVNLQRKVEENLVVMGKMLIFTSPNTKKGLHDVKAVLERQKWRDD